MSAGAIIALIITLIIIVIGAIGAYLYFSGNLVTVKKVRYDDQSSGVVSVQAQETSQASQTATQTPPAVAATITAAESSLAAEQNVSGDLPCGNTVKEGKALGCVYVPAPFLPVKKCPPNFTKVTCTENSCGKKSLCVPTSKIPPGKKLVSARPGIVIYK